MIKEREIAIRNIFGLQRRGGFSGRLTVTVKAWDDPYAPVALDATEGAQETVNAVKGKPEECDLTIIILWSRVGSPLVMDGKSYASGTVWEYQNAAAAKKRVWIYRRTDNARVNLANPKSVMDAAEQYHAMQKFLENLRTSENTPVGINTYSDETQFDGLLRGAFEHWATERLLEAGATPTVDMRHTSSALQSAGNDEMLAMLREFFEWKASRESHSRENVAPNVVHEPQQEREASPPVEPDPVAPVPEPPAPPENIAPLPVRQGGGWTSIVSGWLGRVERGEALRRALRAFFSINEGAGLKAGDETFAALDAWASTEVDVLIAGHSLFPLEHPRIVSQGYYMNTAGWAPVLSLPPAMLRDRDAFDPVFRALTGGLSLTQLVDVRLPDLTFGSRPILVELSTIASVVKDKQVTVRFQSVAPDHSIVALSEATPLKARSVMPGAECSIGVELDEVHVVSDLQLTASPDFSSHRRVQRVMALAAHLTKCTDRRIALVLNGNTFDFRSDYPGTYLDPVNGLSMIQRTMQDTANAPLFDGLKRFVQEPNKYLAVVLGDREVELALPLVTKWFVNLLAPDPASQARVITALDGLGFECSIGGRHVLCLHGHEVDAWNVVDHEQLFTLVRAMKRGVAPPAWKPSGGVRLLSDVIDPMRRKYSFVSALGPMRREVISILITVDPGAISSISEVYRLIVPKPTRDIAGFL